MAEFLHEVVKKREKKSESWLPSYLRNSYDEMATQMYESYQRMYSQSSRAERAIDMIMRNRDNISVGSTINMPVLDINSPANAELVTQYMVYTYTGDAVGTYRGWVRTN